MITERTASFFARLKTPKEKIPFLEKLAKEAALLSQGMTHYEDYLALGALLEYGKPKRIFEIGTFQGVTSDFFLQVLPDVHVISIAYVSRRCFGKKFNNSELSKREVGCYIPLQRRDRFTQLIGDSHRLKPESFKKQYGSVDLVFIDGDHTLSGVRADTDLAFRILAPGGSICWHDANPKESYRSVREYLEIIPQKLIATSDHYVGGIAYWNPLTEEREHASV